MIKVYWPRTIPTWSCEIVVISNVSLKLQTQSAHEPATGTNINAEFPPPTLLHSAYPALLAGISQLRSLLERRFQLLHGKTCDIAQKKMIHAS